jgi:hypothetical protein
MTETTTYLALDGIYAGDERCSACKHMWRVHSRGGVCAGDDGETECYCVHVAWEWTEGEEEPVNEGCVICRGGSPSETDISVGNHCSDHYFDRVGDLLTLEELRELTGLSAENEQTRAEWIANYEAASYEARQRP